ncbi:MAG: methyl-accepting chemotaxis protein, partial [Desulfurella sp.]|uniref:methyl-accepting chemotaxis protein n=1 Tax=Desulfurella sp. TaxID=1962857 RepID=UPI003D102E2C
KPLYHINSLVSTLAKGGGDLTIVLPKNSNDEFGELTDNLNKFISTLKDIVSQIVSKAKEVQSSVNSLATSAAQISASSEQVASNTKEISHATEDTANALSGIARSTEDIRVSSDEAKEITDQMVKQIESNVEAILELSDSISKASLDVNDLGEASKKVGDILKIINDITDQINLLALNAAIEAARAGEHGRGFAVVADEIRKLAEQTQKQSKEIEKTINIVAENFDGLIDGNKMIGDTIDKNMHSVQDMIIAFENLADKINQANKMINSITAGIEQQSSSVEEVAQTVGYLANAVKEISNSLDEISSKSLDLSKMSSQAANIIKKVKVGSPLEKVVEIANQGAKEMKEFIEESIKKGLISSEDIWDRNYIPIPNTNPQKYRTRFTDFFKKYIQPIEDKYLNMDPNFRFFLLTDNNGYLIHNSIYDKPLTGNYEKDLVGNRSMRIFNDPVGLAVARNTDSVIIQVYPRDTGEVMADIGVPVFIEGKHWGGIRVGLAVENI